MTPRFLANTLELTKKGLQNYMILMGLRPPHAAPLQWRGGFAAGIARFPFASRRDSIAGVRWSQRLL